MAEAVHRRGSAIGLQISHTGAHVHVDSGIEFALGPSPMKLTEMSAPTSEDRHVRFRVSRLHCVGPHYDIIADFYAKKP
jgi:2,4-dienoyl-CoA reductase-like NADH-dependent reductase (Old Yellow Enzyme family)